jgi:hypothetical protein
MATQQKNQPGNEKTNQNNPMSNTANDAVEADGTPVLDEKDLEENELAVDEAEDIEWEDKEELEAEALEEEEMEEDEEDEDGI